MDKQQIGSEHDPWLPFSGTSGVRNQRIAIVGYSHHRHTDEVDSADFTRRVVQSVVDGERHGLEFFTRIRNYFLFDESAEFWSRVIFFNFVPVCIGTRDQKYGIADKQQIEAGKLRFAKILAKEKPDKVFVFTSKGWASLPKTLEEEEGQECQCLLDTHSNFRWGTYMVGNRRIAACGFPHPQYSKAELVQEGVKKFLEMPLL